MKHVTGLIGALVSYTVAGVCIESGNAAAAAVWLFASGVWTFVILDAAGLVP